MVGRDSSSCVAKQCARRSSSILTAAALAIGNNVTSLQHVIPWFQPLKPSFQCPMKIGCTVMYGTTSKAQPNVIVRRWLHGSDGGWERPRNFGTSTRGATVEIVIINQCWRTCPISTIGTGTTSSSTSTTPIFFLPLLNDTRNRPHQLPQGQVRQ